MCLLKVAVRQAYANALVKLGKTCERLLALDGDMKNSTYSQEYGKVFPDRHIECFVAEQNMVGVALGCAARGRAIAFSSTFACFFSRAFDQIRMAAVSQAAINFCGSHPGVSIGKSRSYLFVIHFSVTMTSVRRNFQKTLKSHIARVRTV